ncbi:MAG TPA: 4-alpha-glucanotransferase [Vicinamibacterales bacterium]|nr:4-alpha-glucanotransferase [Vicinamibacterales bacterium]
MPRSFAHGRHAGVLVPLFSIPSAGSWGIGEIPDLARCARWLDQAGFDFVQLLPLNEMGAGQNSPYSAMTAMALDPVYIAPGEMPDLAALGGEAALRPADRDCLEAARRAPSIGYADVREMKMRAFRTAFDAFVRQDWERGSARGAALRAFIDAERWWLDDYTLFRALHAREGDRHWREWPAELRERDPAALAVARADESREILFRAYLQWTAAEQWARARRACGAIGVFGDFPFMVSGDSADVWSRQQDFRLEASVGVPPDAFSETGQDWGFPAYRWPEIAAGGYAWIDARARRSAALYDGYRVDHLVGFYRTFVREPDGSSHFVPPDEPSQLAQGERILRILQDTGTRIIAEDLGVVPDFVRASLARLGVPGYRVLRWEREWHVEGQPFRDPAAWPAASVATSGTHDTETLAEWWETAPAEERAAVMQIPGLRAQPGGSDARFSGDVRDALLDCLLASGADLAILPIQDVFGWRDRINTPGRISGDNWTWRLPWPVEDLTSQPEARQRAAFTRARAERYGRVS